MNALEPIETEAPVSISARPLQLSDLMSQKNPDLVDGSTMSITLWREFIHSRKMNSPVDDTT